ncbi:hypothetical protein HPP92_028737 [Vanilla planifolia]|uniref:Uncharacterized protein n=1 Tax=Vanilla planifolia TaxID=51239 RepID=A0A835U2N9_VANPL|nr:hypothetical protein HPP92_028737 [Vanilla planifolia]KAG0446684.1 hypothetical protein HPP92_028726 [Vanilla planifolia]
MGSILPDMDMPRTSVQVVCTKKVFTGGDGRPDETTEEGGPKIIIEKFTSFNTVLLIINEPKFVVQTGQAVASDGRDISQPLSFTLPMSNIEGSRATPASDDIKHEVNKIFSSFGLEVNQILWKMAFNAERSRLIDYIHRMASLILKFNSPSKEELQKFALVSSAVGWKIIGIGDVGVAVDRHPVSFTGVLAPEKERTGEYLPQMIVLKILKTLELFRYFGTDALLNEFLRVHLTNLPPYETADTFQRTWGGCVVPAGYSLKRYQLVSSLARLLVVHTSEPYWCHKAMTFNRLRHLTEKP